MNTKVYSKEAEIKTIEKLIEMGGYFAEFFGRDLEKMCENIKNDYPIEMCTKFSEKSAKFSDTVEYLQCRNDETVKKHALEILDLCDTLLCVHEETGNARLYEHAVEKIGQKNVIARKRILGLKITDDEIDYILSQLNN
jgi:hypothetical protein